MQPGTPAPETKGWIGERYDADAGLQYLNARYYDPALGLFLQPDWFEVTRPGVGTNRFSYSFNDPVNKIDPGGNFGGPPSPKMLEADKKKPKVKTEWEKFTDWFFGNAETRTNRHLQNALTEFGLAKSQYDATLDPADEMFLEHRKRAYAELGAIGRTSTEEAWELFGRPAVDAALNGSIVTSAARAARAATSEVTVFWSGGPKAKAAAAEWAGANGGRTLEMTATGKALENMGTKIAYEKMVPLWDDASKAFAQQSSATVHAFLNNPLATGVWARIELPELMKRNVNIIIHNLAQ